MFNKLPMNNVLIKTKKRLKNASFLALLFLLLMSCEEDFVNIDSTLQGAQNFNATKKQFPLKSYSKSFGEVQTNNLPANLLGYFNEPTYGKTTASIVTQVTPLTFNPDFGNNPTIKSIKLNIPYFSTVIGETSDSGATPHQLDSIFGNKEVALKLSIYENKYLLRELDPNTNFENPQAYYSNAISDLGLETQLGQLVYQNTAYVPLSSQIPDNSDPENTLFNPPALNVFLGPDPLDLMDPNHTFWRDLIMDANGNALSQLSNANNFKEFFRGLIFKIEPLNADPANDSFQIMLDLNNPDANITINYTNENNDGESVDQNFVLNFSGIKFNTLENNYNFPLPNGDLNNLSDHLYIKGGVGSAGIINLFNGNVEDENGDMVLSEPFFRSKKDQWLINQANLTVYVDQSSLPNNTDGKNEPNRLVLYDLKNNIPIADYFLDTNTTNQDPDQSRILYAEPLERDTDNKGVKYKFRVTEHLNNILKKDSTNVNLGIYVSTNVNLLLGGNGTRLLNSVTFGFDQDQDDTTLDDVPSTCILSPRGTVLYGSTLNVPENLRPKLEIFYTESEN